MGTNYEYNAENFEEILSRLQNDEAGLSPNSNFVDPENELGNFNFSDLEGLNLDETNSRCNDACPGASDDINSGTLGIGNNNDCLCGTGVVNARECYEKGLREGLEQGFVRGLNRGRQQGRQEGYNAGLERGLSRAQELARAAYQKGYRCGYERGFRAGYQKGFRDGCNAGFERGARAGFNNGFRRGYDRALRDVSRYIDTLRANVNGVNGVNAANVNGNGSVNPSWRTVNNL